jgi:hypothetical protein
MGGCAHSQPLIFLAKTRRYGRWVVDQNAKTTDFPGEDAVFKKRGSGTGGLKMRIPTRKARSLWFLTPETTRIFAETGPNGAQTL